MILVILIVFILTLGSILFWVIQEVGEELRKGVDMRLKPILTKSQRLDLIRERHHRLMAQELGIIDDEETPEGEAKRHIPTAEIQEAEI